MVENVLVNSGFIKNETYEETLFRSPPKCTYAIYKDSFESRGSDDTNLVKEHNCTIDLYSYEEDPEAEKRIEGSLDALGISYVKQERYWIVSEELFQVIYEFDYIEKIRRL